MLEGWATHNVRLFIARYYDKIKYQQNIYEVGEYIEIYSITAESYVAKLNKIIEIPKEK